MIEYNITSYGAVGDGTTDDAKAIQTAIDTCNQAGGGRVLVPSGHTFLSGPFFLKSNIEFFVQPGARILANPDESVYTRSAFKENKGEGTIWIGGDNVAMLSITGGGIIDGNGVAFMGDEQPDAYDLKPFDEVDPRPHLLTLIGGKNIKISGITFSNAAYWGLHLVGCEDVSIAQTTVLNSLKVRNCDGIDLDHCRNVRIADCHIESGDDCICFKNRREYAEHGPCENITVTGCTLTSTSCAIKIGSENMDNISFVTFNNCIIRNSNRGIGIQHRDEGEVSNIIFTNMIIECRLFSDVWWGKAEPIYITAYPRASNNHKDAGWRLPEGNVEGRVGQIKNITFSNIRCISENGIFVEGESSDKVQNIRFNDIDLSINKTSRYDGGMYDCRPRKGEDMVTGRTSGFYLSHASRIFVNDCSVSWGDHRPDYFHCVLESHHVAKLEIDNLNGDAAHENIEPVQVNHSEWTLH